MSKSKRKRFVKPVLNSGYPPIKIAAAKRIFIEKI